MLPGRLAALGASWRTAEFPRHIALTGPSLSPACSAPPDDGFRRENHFPAQPTRFQGGSCPLPTASLSGSLREELPGAAQGGS